MCTVNLAAKVMCTQYSYCLSFDVLPRSQDWVNSGVSKYSQWQLVGDGPCRRHSFPACKALSRVGRGISIILDAALCKSVKSTDNFILIPKKMPDWNNARRSRLLPNGQVH